ncbi:MAG: PilZ domain-containing protein [Syntrophobacteraceae bacterium]
MERRKNRRVPFQVIATVQTGQISTNGMVDNLSMKGMFFTTRETLPGGNPLEISIILSGSTSLLSIKLKGRVVRQTEAGIAIEFQEMDLDSFTHLRNIIAQNTDDADAAYEEYCRSIMSQ